MTAFLIDLGVIGIVAFCGWRGYRNGLIRGVFGFVTLIASLFLANTIAGAYSEEFTGMLNPFVGGLIESAITDSNKESSENDLSGIDLSNTDLKDIDLSNFDPSDIRAAEAYLEELGLTKADLNDVSSEQSKYLTAYVALRHFGLPESSSSRIAQMTAEDTSDRFISDVISGYLSSLISYIALFGIAFLLLVIAFTVIGNLIGFVFSLPGFKLVDIIAGSVFGVVKGLLIVLTIGVVLRYFGLLARDILEETSLLRFVVNNNIIADILGV